MLMHCSLICTSSIFAFESKHTTEDFQPVNSLFVYIKREEDRY